jgi:MFS family permease
MSVFFSIMGARLIISPLVPDLLEAYSTSKGALGVAFTGMWAAYGVLQFPGGMLGDKFGERRIIVLGTTLTFLGVILATIAPSFPIFGVAVVLIGAGGGVYFPVAGALLTRLSDDISQALSFHVAGGNAAGLLLPPVAGYVSIRYGWRSAVMMGAIVVLVMVVFSSWGLRPTPAQRPDLQVSTEINPQRIISLLTQPSIAYTTILAVLMAFVFQAILSFFPTFLVEFRGFSTVDASTLFSAIFAVIVLVLPLMGRLSDITSPDVAIGVCSVAIILGLSATLVQGSVFTAIAGAGLIGVGTTWGGVIGARFMMNFSVSERGTGYGLVRSVYVVLGSAGNVIIGSVADMATWPVAFSILIGILVVVLVLLLANYMLNLQL